MVSHVGGCSALHIECNRSVLWSCPVFGHIGSEVLRVIGLYYDQAVVPFPVDTSIVTRL